MDKRFEKSRIEINLFYSFTFGGIKIMIFNICGVLSILICLICGPLSLYLIKRYKDTYSKGEIIGVLSAGMIVFIIGILCIVSLMRVL